MSGEKRISSRTAIRGLKWFIALSIAGLLLNFLLTSVTESIRYLTRLNPSFFIVALALNMLDWLLGGTRILVLATQVFPRIEFKACIKANLSNVFLGAVTPAQTGGGAAQIYMLYKNGMPFAEATVASIISFLGSISFLIICAIYLIFFGHVPAMNPSLLLLSRVTLLVFSAVILLFTVAVVKPQTFEKATKRFLSVIPVLKKLRESRKLQAFFDSVKKYQDIMRIYVSKGKLALLATFVLSSVTYLNKFFIAYIVLKGMGLDVPFIQTIFIQMILFLIFYFSPTPGASGVAELSSARLMGQIIPKASQAVFTMLWRTFTLYVGVAVGGVIMLRHLLAQDSSPKV
ncbi:MAG: lysylphosphatidylglycerol synthase transmembrane domain-containing protein [Candidatus Poribacteria bacterium]|nr:lysylphosphatidylglycerol synthase transmembrane domain-containing protein [Candidatus Poribacteria bacterium]MDE0504061.1 lysylphosphatidylglycerol synthase transmembrane domain-containing protein [Candidatus Poribacteria bacterium]